MINEDAGEVIAYRPVYEHRRRRRVYPPREATDRLCIADLLPYLLDRVGDDVDRRPVRRATADLKEEVLEHLHPVLGVPHLRVELHPEEALLRLLEGDDRDGGRLGGDREAFGRSKDRVAVAHPRHLLVRRAREEEAMLLYAEVRAAILPYLDGPDLSAQVQRHQLHPVADTQDRHAKLKDPLVHPRRPLTVDAARSSGKDNALRFARRDLLDGRIIGEHLRVDARLTHAPGDQLRVLATEV